MKKKYPKYFVLISILISGVSTYAQINHIVQVSNFAFSPAAITVTAGDTVTFQWVNGSHTTTSDSTTGSDSWNSPISSSVPVFKKVVLYPGLHRYYCIPHGSPGGLGMAGTITANPKAPTFVKESNTGLSYSLEQNYPNPFNPSTKITYSIAENSPVTLKIYNILGEEVATLVNEVQSRGNYTVIFNAAEFTSGIYYYQIKAGSFSLVRKMTLIK